MATLHKMTSLFTSIATSDFPYIYPQKKINSRSGVVKMIITPDMVTSVEKYIFDTFLTALDVDVDFIDNYGIASYNDENVANAEGVRDGSYIGNCPVYFGLGEPDGEESLTQMGIIIGAKNDTFETSSYWFPCEVEKEVVKRGKKTFDEFVYTINGNPLTLQEQKDNDGNVKLYLQLEYRNEEGEDIYFSFPFLVDKSIVLTNEDILREFRNGTFDSVLRKFSSGNGGGRIWLESHKAFLNLFKEKTFPSTGVYFLCHMGKKKVTPINPSLNITSPIHQVEWEILATSHPELVVQYKAKDKTFDFICLSDATNIQFTKATTNNEGYTFMNNNHHEVYAGCVLIHIVKPSLYNPEKNSPVNTLTTLPQRILAAINSNPNFAHMLPIYEQNGNMTAAVKQEVKQAVEAKKEATADDIFPNYKLITHPQDKPGIVIEEVVTMTAESENAKKLTNSEIANKSGVVTINEENLNDIDWDEVLQ